MTATQWTADALAAEGMTPLPSLGPGQYFQTTGFFIENGAEPGTARVTVTAKFRGQDSYEHLAEAERLANHLMDILERHGATFEEIQDREPNCAFDVHTPDGEQL